MSRQVCWSLLASLALLVATTPALAQPRNVTGLSWQFDDGVTKGPRVTFGAGDPTGGANGDVYVKTDGTMWQRMGGTWLKTGNVHTNQANVFAAGFNQTFGGDILAGVAYTSNIGADATKFLSLHVAELWVQTLVAQQTLATVGGRVMVAPTTTLTSDLGAAGTTIYVKHNSLANGDVLLLESGGKFEAMAVTSGAGGGGPYNYSVTRNLDGSGANDWYAGDAIVDTGQAGSGWVDIFSTYPIGLPAGNGPAVQMKVRNSTTWNDFSVRLLMGKLEGYGYTSTSCGGSWCYGFAAGVPSGAWVKVDPTNGVRLGYNATTNTQIDASGNATFSGTVNASGGYFGDGATRVAIEAAGINVGNTGSIRGGQTAYNTGNGFWLGYTGGAYKFSIGDSAGEHLTWDGSAFTWTGAGFWTDTGSMYLSASTSTGTQRTYTFSLTGNGDGMRYWTDDGGHLLVLTDDALDLISADPVYFSTDINRGTRQSIYVSEVNAASDMTALGNIYGNSFNITGGDSGCSGTPDLATAGVVTGCVAADLRPAALAARIATLEAALAALTAPATPGGAASRRR